ncbi:MAG: biopolymer transporter ExbD [Shewanella sp.]|nr:biopolymer transporter ExbD [Shewanella sp.]
MKLNTSNARRPHISLTPLIDVVFILLIFFMLVTKMDTYQSLKLYLSQVESAPSQMQEKRVVQIALQSNGHLRFQDQEYTPEAFSQKVPADTISKLNILIASSVTAQVFVSIKERLVECGYTHIEEWVVSDEN